MAETAFLDRLEALGPVVLATEDGSSGFEGVAVDALKRHLSEVPADAETIFYNCGPEIVLAQVDTVEREIVVPERPSRLPPADVDSPLYSPGSRVVITPAGPSTAELERVSPSPTNGS
ncbi:MAG: hypothetical protein ACODAA_06725 [Gemmatimonadota bacterium]